MDKNQLEKKNYYYTIVIKNLDNITGVVEAWMNVSFLLSDFKFPPTPDCGILHKLTMRQLNLFH